MCISYRYNYHEMKISQLINTIVYIPYTELPVHILPAQSRGGGGGEGASYTLPHQPLSRHYALQQLSHSPP